MSRDERFAAVDALKAAHHAAEMRVVEMAKVVDFVAREFGADALAGGTALSRLRVAIDAERAAYLAHHEALMAAVGEPVEPAAEELRRSA